jgi:hypothetical protein
LIQRIETSDVGNSPRVRRPACLKERDKALEAFSEAKEVVGLVGSPTVRAAALGVSRLSVSMRPKSIRLRLING